MSAPQSELLTSCLTNEQLNLLEGSYAGLPNPLTSASTQFYLEHMVSNEEWSQHRPSTYVPEGSWFSRPATKVDKKDCLRYHHHLMVQHSSHSLCWNRPTPFYLIWSTAHQGCSAPIKYRIWMLYSTRITVNGKLSWFVNWYKQLFVGEAIRQSNS